MTSTARTHQVLDVPALLSSGGDTRSNRVGRRKSNRYGCRFEPEEGLLAAGSCTGSTISAHGYRAVTDALEGVDLGDPDAAVAWSEAELGRVRRRLRHRLLGSAATGAEIVLTPSGTDAEFLPVLLVGAGTDAPVANVVLAPSEVGSGTLLAAGGSHFSTQVPSGRTVDVAADAIPDVAVSTVTVDVRDAVGALREPDDIDAEVEATVQAALAAGSVVVLHVVAHSKTGVHAPSLDLVAELEARHGDRLHVVVDAAQGRISRRGLRHALRRNRFLILTGSKFYGGPPFAGALLVPERYARRLTTELTCPRALQGYFSRAEAPRTATVWRASLEVPANPGLTARWIASMAEIDRYYDIAEPTRLAIMRTFEEVAPEIIGASGRIELETPPEPPVDDAAERLLGSKQTVMSFLVRDDDGRRLDADELRAVQHEMRTGAAVLGGSDIEAIETGQPVVISAAGDAVLRIALGAPLAARWATPTDPTDRRRLVAADLELVVESIDRAAQAIHERRP